MHSKQILKVDFCRALDFLHWQIELLALEDPKVLISKSMSRRAMKHQSLLGVVDVEEIGVQNGLNKTCDDRDGLKVALCGIAIDPVGNVQGSVSTQGKEVVGGDGLCLACSLQHEQLGKNGNSF